MTWPEVEMTILRIGAAFIFGALVGFERQWRKRNAGLRTNALVSVGAALFVIISAKIYSDDVSPTRIASQVVIGIGFLGAGVIMKEGLNIRGLNTAATLWCSAAIGSLSGFGFYVEALLGAITIIGTHLLLRPLGTIIEKGPLSPGIKNATYKLSIICTKNVEVSARAMLVNIIGNSSLEMHSLKSYNDFKESNIIEIVALIVSPGRHDQVLEDMAGLLSLENGVKNISWEFISESDPDDLY